MIDKNIVKNVVISRATLVYTILVQYSLYLPILVAMVVVIVSVVVVKVVVPSVVVVQSEDLFFVDYSL